MKVILAAIAVITFTASDPSFAQRTEAEPSFTTTKIAGNLHLLQSARGGNIVAMVGDDGVLLVDTQYAPIAVKLPDALKRITDKPVRYVINTHYHADHTDGNVLFPGASIIAHENVRKRLATGGVGGNYDSFRFEYKALPAAALPAITFTDQLTLHFNGEDIRITHYPASHTDGDAIVYFPKANVVHVGDQFVTYGFPDIEIASGGRAQRNIDALERIIATFPKDVIVIPGHGPVSTLDDVRRFAEMLKGTLAAVRKGVAQGKSLEQLQKEEVLEPWKSWGGGLFNQDVFIEFLYNDLTNKKTWGK